MRVLDATKPSSLQLREEIQIKRSFTASAIGAASAGLLVVLAYSRATQSAITRPA